MSVDLKSLDESEKAVNELGKSGDLGGTTAVVTGAGRGFGRGIAGALVGAGAHVIGVGPTGGHLDAVRDELGPNFTAVVADAADPPTASLLLHEYRPRAVVLCAGAAPSMRPLHEHTWESFSANWNIDVAQAFSWTGEILRNPLEPGGSVIVFSSGAALHGSVLSGGYAGAKATVRFIARYAADESERAALGIEFVSVLPQLTPATDLGATAVAAYAAREGLDVETFLRSRGPALTPEQVGKSVLELVTTDHAHHAYTLTAAGIAPLA